MNESSQVDLLSRLETAIRRFEVRRIAAPGFPPELEIRYQGDTALARSRMLMLHGLIALLAYDLFIVGDYLLAPAHFMRAVITRFAIVTPITLLVAFYCKGRRDTPVLEFAASMLCLLGSVSVLYLHQGISAMVTAEAQAGLLLILLVANCMVRLELPIATALSGLILLLDGVWLCLDRQMIVSQKMFSGGVLVWGALLTLTINYMLTRERRYSYLLQLRGRMQRSLLAGVNAELLALSSTDRLTGLPNRHSYEDRFAKLWQIAVERREPMSIVMVDVDFFKRINDTHGHPYGDKVLQRVASLLEQALRAEDDFVARYGGEEFIVVLPSTDSEGALKVSERIRTLVQVAGSPALQRDTPMSASDVWTTISCGVATSWPVAAQDPAYLVADADAALYRAKREGRNRSCCAPPVTPAANLLSFPVAGLA